MVLKAAALYLALFLCVLLPLTMAQDDDPWFWIMADSKNSTTTCPGRCLAVNDSGAMDYNDRPVIFVACKVGSTSDSTTSNQRWIRDVNTNTTIRFNASAASDDPQAGILCLEAIQNPNQALKLSTCTGRMNQQWIVANDSIKTLAFNPPPSLAMAYSLAGFLNSSDGLLGYRRATILTTPNKSFTTTFSMIDGTLETPPPLPIQGNETLNFILNGGFEQSSYDFPNSTASLPVTTSDPFSLCSWQVMKDSATLSPNPNPNSETNRSLLLKDGVVRQIVGTSPGAFYTLILNVAAAAAAPDPSDSNNQCSGNDTLSVNPYPSSNLHQDLHILNRSWTKQHLSFQAVGSTMQLAFQGCATCGCYLSDLNLIQVLGPSPFPPPPPRPSPPTGPHPANNTENSTPYWPGFSRPDRFRGSKRLSNGAVVGIVVATAALFFTIGGACFWVLVGKKRDLNKENEMSMGRPGEWSIQTTTPGQSQAAARGNSSTAVPQTTTPSAIAVSASSLQTVPT